MCCSGAQFYFVPVKDDEIAPLEALGFSIETEEEQRGFALGCPRFADCRCTIYAQRPNVCARYRCETLVALEKGEIDADLAITRVGLVKQAIGQVEALLEPGQTLRSAKDQMWVKPSGDEPGQLTPGLKLAVVALELVLDRYLRKPDHRQLELQSAGAMPGAEENPTK